MLIRPAGHMDAGQSTCWRWRRRLTQHFFMFMTAPSASQHPPLLPSGRNTFNGIRHTRHWKTRSHWGECLGMFWKTGVLVVGCVLLPFCLLGAESSGRWGKSVTFHRTRGKKRPERETSSSSNTGNSSQGHAFTSCHIPLTPAEHEVLDDNTHEVRWVWLTL